MNADLKSAQDDLAYLKSLVSGSETRTRLTGQLFLAGGLIYAAECVFHWGQALGWAPGAGLGALAGTVGPTVLFLIILTVLIARNRGLSTGGSASRAANAAFGAAGASNLAAIIIFGSVAAAQHSFIIWLLYPCMVFVLQGAAWLVAATLYRRLWYGGVALGWFATAIGMALTIGTATFAVLVAAGLLLFMALPGYVMVRAAAKAA
jgi:hypothetical protein